MIIIHLTDLHLKVERNAENNRRFRKIAERLNSDVFDETKHVIIITGDLIDNAYHNGAMVQAKAHLDLLLPKYSGRLFVCPGNHDYGSFSGGNAQYIREFFETFSDFLGSSQIFPRDEYVDLGDPHFEIDGEPLYSPFPTVNDFGDCLFIGLDSMEGEFASDVDGRDLGAEGKLG